MDYESAANGLSRLREAATRDSKSRKNFKENSMKLIKCDTAETDPKPERLFCQLRASALRPQADGVTGAGFALTVMFCPIHRQAEQRKIPPNTPELSPS